MPRRLTRVYGKGVVNYFGGKDLLGASCTTHMQAEGKSTLQALAHSIIQNTFGLNS